MIDSPRFGLCAIWVVWVCVAAAGSGGCAGPADSRPAVVVISVDGLAGYYIDDPKAEMPRIRALAAQGARAESMRAVTPSVTWPTHTSIATGVEPARHGVVGNNYLDRATGRTVVLIGDPELDKDRVVKVPTIYDVAKGASLRTAAVRWPATRNAATLDWMVPAVSSRTLYERYTTPALRAACERAGVWRYEEGSEPANPDRVTMSDEACADVFGVILREQRPDLGLLHLVHLDHQQHLYGPKSPEAYAAVREADALVGRVWDETQRVYGDRATLVVVSDHGFSPIEKLVLHNVVLRDAGLLDVKGGRVVGGAVRVVSQGGTAMVYVTDPARRDEVAGRVKEAFKGNEGVQAVVTPDGFARYGVADPRKDANAPDVLVFAKEGYAFGDTAAGTLAFREKPERKGTHGHDPHLPVLHATFVACGRGITPGARLGEVRQVDVAPTVARLLGLTMEGVDGVVLEGAVGE